MLMVVDSVGIWYGFQIAISVGNISLSFCSRLCSDRARSRSETKLFDLEAEHCLYLILKQSIAVIPLIETYCGASCIRSSVHKFQYANTVLLVCITWRYDTSIHIPPTFSWIKSAAMDRTATTHLFLDKVC